MDSQIMMEEYSQLITLALRLKPVSVNSRMVYPDGKSFSRKDIRRLFEAWLGKYSDRFDSEMARAFENNLENVMNNSNFTDRSKEIFSKLFN